MQIVFATRGIKDKVDNFINDLQAQFYPHVITNPETGEQMITQVQGALRPVQLWEYTVPETQYNSVMATLGITNDHLAKDYILAKWKLSAMRKALGVEKCPVVDKALPRPIRRDWVSIHPIGIVRDKQGVVTKNGYTGEIL